MIRSMTGLCAARAPVPMGTSRLGAEDRQSSLSLRSAAGLPEEFRAAEADFRQAIAAAVRRGKVDCSLHFRPAGSPGALEVDAELLASFTERARKIAAQAGAAARIEVARSAALAGRGARARPRCRPDDRRRARAARRSARRARAFSRQRGCRLREALELRCAGLADFAARGRRSVCRRCVPHARQAARAHRAAQRRRGSRPAGAGACDSRATTRRRRGDRPAARSCRRGAQSIRVSGAGRTAPRFPDAGAESRSEHACRPSRRTSRPRARR